MSSSDLSVQTADPSVLAPGSAGPAWNELADRLRPFIRRRVARPHDADDVLQDVLLRVHRGLPGLDNEDRFGPWMYRIARTSIADHLRDRARHPSSQRDTPVEHEVEPFAEDEDAVARQVAQYVAAYVAFLPSPYREAVTLTELEGRTQKEAAEMLGCTLSAMKSRVQRGRAKIREMLEACCEVAVDARGKVISCEPRPAPSDPSDCCP